MTFRLCSYHSEYGVGYQWRPENVTIQVGDTVEWEWTGSAFTTLRSVVQVKNTTCRSQFVLKCVSYILHFRLQIKMLHSMMVLGSVQQQVLVADFAIHSINLEFTIMCQRDTESWVFTSYHLDQR